jgi:ribosomal protein S6--L-glutamate ligase
MRPVNVALASFLRPCPDVTTIGIRALIGDYSGEEQALLARARRIFFPTIRFVDIFHAAGKACFPSYFNYKIQRSRILQATLLSYSNWPHPPTRIYFGPRQKSRIPMDFGYPFLLMGPLARADTRHLVEDEATFRRLAASYNPVIVQAHSAWRESIRLICVAFECLAAFRTAFDHGDPAGTMPIPAERVRSMELWSQTKRLLTEARLDDMAVEWGLGSNGWRLIEMSRPPASMESPRGIIHRHHHICRLIQRGIL